MSMLINSFYKLKENRIKIPLKGTRIPKIVNVSYDLTDLNTWSRFSY